MDGVAGWVNTPAGALCTVGYSILTRVMSLSLTFLVDMVRTLTVTPCKVAIWPLSCFQKHHWF